MKHNCYNEFIWGTSSRTDLHNSRNKSEEEELEGIDRGITRRIIKNINRTGNHDRKEKVNLIPPQELQNGERKTLKCHCLDLINKVKDYG